LVVNDGAQVVDSPVLAPPRPLRLSRKHALSAGVVILLIAAILSAHRWWTIGRFIETTDDAYVGGNVTEISPHVSGFITAILVSDNQRVSAGQELIRIDAADFAAVRDHAAATVEQRQATLANLHAQTALQHSLIDQALADLESRRDDAAFAAQDAKRYRDLAITKAGSGRDADKAQTADRTAQSAVAAGAARLDATRKQLAVLDAAVKEAQAALGQSQAELATARLNLGYTEIRSPIDGYVGDRSAQVGAYVTAGTHLLSIVPARDLWVDANFKEDQPLRAHLRRCGGSIRSAQLHLPIPCGGSAGTHEPQFPAWMHSFVRHRDGYFCTDLSDPAVSGLRSRIQRLADRDRHLLDGRGLPHRRAGLRCPCAAYGSALADDVRARLFRYGDVGL
jgi:membrane fusion protein (multidrug efflux system)